MGIIFYFSSQPHLPTAPYPLLELLWKKAAHLGEYALLGWLLQRAASSASEGRPNAPSFYSLSIAVAYAMTDELHQMFTPGRSASPWDIIVDALGSAIGVALWCRYRKDKDLPE